MKRGRLFAAAICSCLLASSGTADAMVMLGPRRESRYFAVQQMLPPLSRDMASFENSTVTLPYSSSHGEPLPVVYTNNPKVVTQWLSNHIPSSDGILGFDVEVSCIRTTCSESNDDYQPATLKGA